MSRLTDRIDRFVYPDMPRRHDDHVVRTEILRRLRPDHVMLDLGAGAGRRLALKFRGCCRQIVDVDLDPRVLDNPFLDEAQIASAYQLPFIAASFDVVIAVNVLEHIDDPVRLFAEVRRVLKPGGAFIVRMPNRYHLVPTIAQLTPHRFHVFIARLHRRAAEDTFPTLYRANTRAAIRRHAPASGLAVELLRCFEGRPSYLLISAPLFRLGVPYERLVNSTALFEPFRVSLVAVLRRPASTTRTIPARPGAQPASGAGIS